jgi:predicted ATPase/DNA-binding winged helix-turn-helix (wHTH) protein
LEIDLGRRELRARGTPVALGDRAFEILAVLVQSAGDLVTKERLMRRIWPGAVVEENTLEGHVSALRRALGPDREILRTAYARGYRLMGTWAVAPEDAPAGAAVPKGPATPAPRHPRSNLPAAGSDLIGRAVAVRHVLELLAAHRVVTLTGVGGIGKTRLALEAARGISEALRDDFHLWFIELASLKDGSLVPFAVARAIGLAPGADASSAEAVTQAIGDARTLLVLDNCEHVIDAAAALADTVLRLCPRATVLATSRELLRIDGEHAYRVPPLDLPAERVDADRLLDCGATALFIARARALEAGFSQGSGDAAAIATICQHLDGIPLAIEFAAARAASIGVGQVAAGLGDRFGLLTVGRRTAVPRHQTLRAALDWSYELLPDGEAAVLRRLAVFAGAFPLEAAIAVAGNTARQSVVDCLAGLVAKSLVVADLGGPAPHYRLLETVRAYAHEKLQGAGEQPQVMRRHAEYYLALSAQAEAEGETRAEADWSAAYGRHLDDWRAALDWAFSPDGDAAIGLALTIGLLPVWFKLSLMGECRNRVAAALACPRLEPDLRSSMRLNAALAEALFYTDRGAVPDVAAAWDTVLTNADRLNDVEHRLWARWGLWLHQMVRGTFREALASARSFRNLAADPADLAAGDRMLGFSLHFLGEQAQARSQLEASLARRLGGAARPTIRVPYDQGLATRAYLPRVLWLQGFPERAMRAATEVVRDAREGGHWLAFSVALVQAGCPVALLTGDLRTTEEFVAALIDTATAHGLGFWRAEGRCYEGILRAMKGDATGGLETFRRAVQELSDHGTGMNLSGHLAGMAGALAGTAEATHGATLVEEALCRGERHEDRWCVPELLRLQGEFLLHAGAPDTEAEALFRQALRWAGQQDAPSWALRSATSLARLLRSNQRLDEARAVLAPVYAAFNEGQKTADLMLAERLLLAIGRTGQERPREPRRKPSPPRLTALSQ